MTFSQERRGHRLRELQFKIQSSKATGKREPWQGTERSGRPPPAWGLRTRGPEPGCAGMCREVGASSMVRPQLATDTCLDPASSYMGNPNQPVLVTMCRNNSGGSGGTKHTALMLQKHIARTGRKHEKPLSISLRPRGAIPEEVMSTGEPPDSVHGPTLEYFPTHRARLPRTHTAHCRVLLADSRRAEGTAARGGRRLGAHASLPLLSAQLPELVLWNFV